MMILDKIIAFYKKKKTQNLIEEYSISSGAYAFIGIGNHSIENLYSCARLQGVSFKYVYSRNEEKADSWAKSMDAKACTDLSEIWNDAEVKAVFICANPKSHFELSKQALLAGKHVFVEKPVCYSLNELNELIDLSIQKQLYLQVGFQRSFAPAYQIMEKNIKQVKHYRFEYECGAYPEGDVWYELFIHQIHILCRLFGKVKDIHIQESNSNTWILNLKHENDCVGSCFLSTDFSWNGGKEYLQLSDGSRHFKLDYPTSLISEEKELSLMGIPMEKLISRPKTQKTLFDLQLHIPSMEHSSFRAQGFWGEIKYFISCVEGNSQKINREAYHDLVCCYEVLDKIK